MAKSQKKQSPDAHASPDAGNLAEDARARYRECVVRVARGGPEPDKADLVELLVLAGRSAEDFARNTATLRRRLEAAELLEEDTAALQAHLDARRELDEAEAAAKAVTFEVNRKIAEARDAVDKALRKLERAGSAVHCNREKAREVLRETTDPQLIEEAQRLEAAGSQADYQAKLAKAKLGGTWGANQLDVDLPVKKLEAIRAKRRELGARMMDPVDGMAW